MMNRVQVQCTKRESEKAFSTVVDNRLLPNFHIHDTESTNEKRTNTERER